MGVIVLLLVASILIAVCFLVAFLASTREGQYDDLETPALRILLEDRAVPASQAGQSTVRQIQISSNSTTTTSGAASGAAVVGPFEDIEFRP